MKYKSAYIDKLSIVEHHVPRVCYRVHNMEHSCAKSNLQGSQYGTNVYVHTTYTFHLC